MSTSSFLERNKSFVLKLRLVGVGGDPQIRRVKLSRIAVGGAVSYDALVGVAISYTFPEALLVVENYEVALTYYDVDNDCVTIASTEELIDAIEQFEENLVLRVTTDVKQKKNHSVPPPASSSRAASAPTPTLMQGTKQATQIQNVLGSLVSSVGSAVVALQDQAKNADAAAAAPSAHSSFSGASLAASAAGSVPGPGETGPNVPQEKGEAKGCVEGLKMENEGEPEQETPGPVSRPFIHGRHTCDGCLCTPIIGLRYHATNLPDYDLCARCRENYKGSEIQFVSVELERDLPLQERWQKKRERWANRDQGGPRGKGMPRRQCGRHSGARARNTRNRREGLRHREQQSVDEALREAIRRSLQDTKAEDETVEPPPPVPSAPLEEPVPNVAVATAASSLVDEPQNEPAKEPQNEPAVSAGFSSGEPQQQQVAAIGKQVQEQSSDVLPPVSVAAVEIPVQKLSVKSAPKETNLPQEESFSSDAEGNGEVAHELGVTLDECARAISAMMTELDRKNSFATGVDAEDSDDETYLNEEKSGETIVEGEVERDNESFKSSGEWEVVQQDEQVAGDAALARAAQLIGSALFESEVSGQADGASTLTASAVSTLSVPSSVPTESPSQIPPAVSNRWAEQLFQLHELGFVDDLKSVEILERLNAANIGVGSDEEISLTQVVNELLK